MIIMMILLTIIDVIFILGNAMIIVVILECGLNCN